MLLRAGAVRRPHFAHKSLQNCAYGHASPRRLQARAILYARLVQEFGSAVTLEKQLEETSLSSPVDCWVERPSGPLAYWIIEGSIKSQQERRNLRQAFAEEAPKDLKKPPIHVNWVFLNTGADENSDAKRIDLNTTEREFIAPSPFDRIGGTWADEGQGSLHHLDPEAETLTTLRSLRPVHKPRFYAARRLTNPLANVLTVPKTGEFVHPGERELWQEERARREEQRAQQAREKQLQEEARQKWLAAEEQRVEEQHKIQQERQRLLPTLVVAPSNLGINRLTSARQTEWSGSHQFKEGTCRLCGTKTRDWFFFDNVTHICECNACLRQKGKMRSSDNVKG